MTFLVQFGIIKCSQIFRHNFLYSLNNFLVLIYFKLISKSFDYLYKQFKEDIITHTILTAELRPSRFELVGYKAK